ncbi:MAG: hypothetical protein V7L13_18480 [Nostoc sp.]
MILHPKAIAFSFTTDKRSLVCLYTPLSPTTENAIAILIKQAASY